MRVPSIQKKFIFHSRLYSLRILVPISQSELAAELGVRRQTIAAIESDQKQPSLLTAFRIAQYFKTTIDALFTFRS